MLDQRANFRVDDFIIAAAAAGAFAKVEATVFVELIKAIDGIFGQVEGQAQGLVVEPTHLGEVVFIDVLFGGDWLKGELNEWGFFSLVSLCNG